MFSNVATKGFPLIKTIKYPAMKSQSAPCKWCQCCLITHTGVGVGGGKPFTLGLPINTPFLQIQLYECCLGAVLAHWNAIKAPSAKFCISRPSVKLVFQMSRSLWLQRDDLRMFWDVLQKHLKNALMDTLRSESTAHLISVVDIRNVVLYLKKKEAGSEPAAWVGTF